ncbi:sterol desaturase family protein [Microbulbifer spongiae]|uniref:Sterol desaturase family protein n=1 Tax=Microbulbifer spongiae TaxID=2944933 RepID=A0ABY9EAP4_9GAMM|nr:sterol desaturase family protein [Microbulbifer sp. MI-G]WKD49158.1 sterol desaturase family protein [Microbulbifer sp. MI-G]
MDFLMELAQYGAKHFHLTLFRYVLAASVMSICAGWLFRTWMHRRRIQKRRAEWKDIRREVSFSMLTVCIFTVIGTIISLLEKMGLTKLYWQWGDYPMWWNIASLPVLILLHDAYFYWTHRGMHHPKIFKHFHRLHHLSRTPTPWTAYSFSVGEAALNGLFSPLIILMIPMHPTIWLSFVFIMIFRNAMLHTGCEFHPRNWVDGPLDNMTTTTHHDLHHQRFQGNYGFYFTWWDRWMGTEFKDYKLAFRRAVDGTLSDASQEKTADARTNLSQGGSANMPA